MCVCACVCVRIACVYVCKQFYKLISSWLSSTYFSAQGLWGMSNSSIWARTRTEQGTKREWVFDVLPYCTQPHLLFFSNIWESSKSPSLPPLHTQRERERVRESLLAAQRDEYMHFKNKLLFHVINLHLWHVTDSLIQSESTCISSHCSRAQVVEPGIWKPNLWLSSC